jgi:hypothetical protein
MAEAEAGDGVLQRHEKLIVAPRIVLRAAEQDLINDAAERHRFQPVVDHESLVVPAGQLAGALEQHSIVGATAPQAEVVWIGFDPVDDSVVELQFDARGDREAGLGDGGAVGDVA